MSDNLLSVRNLVVDYEIDGRRVRSLDSASLEVDAGQVVAVVGESGSGKSTLGLAIARLLASNATYVSGSVTLDGREVATASPSMLRALRESVVSYIFQNPISALDPTMRVRDQLRAAVRDRLDSEAALVEVGLVEIDRVLTAFPHQLSGGMAQRVGIALALSRSPRLLVADEPTASVDATGRERLMEMLVQRCQTTGCTLLMLTHDLHAVRKYTTHVAVMYAGRIVEFGPSDEILAAPEHPYTRALLAALPGEERYGERLLSIPGSPPVLDGPSEGCAFAPRCPVAMEVCVVDRPVLERPHDPAPGSARLACCHLASGAISPRLAGVPQPAIGSAAG